MWDSRRYNILYDQTVALVLITVFYLIALLALNWLIISFAIKTFCRQKTKKAFQIELVWVAFSATGQMFSMSLVGFNIVPAIFGLFLAFL